RRGDCNSRPAGLRDSEGPTPQLVGEHAGACHQELIVGDIETSLHALGSPDGIGFRLTVLGALENTPAIADGSGSICPASSKSRGDHGADTILLSKHPPSHADHRTRFTPNSTSREAVVARSVPLMAPSPRRIVGDSDGRPRHHRGNNSVNVLLPTREDHALTLSALAPAMKFDTSGGCAGKGRLILQPVLEPVSSGRSDSEVELPRTRYPTSPTYRHTPWWLRLLRRPPPGTNRRRQSGGGSGGAGGVACNRDSAARQLLSEGAPSVLRAAPPRERGGNTACGTAVGSERWRQRCAAPRARGEVRRRARRTATCTTASSLSFL
ncbi:unnamed protein product, partial [Sphacelaria rigidula]